MAYHPTPNFQRSRSGNGHFHSRFQALNEFNTARKELEAVSKEHHLRQLGDIICRHGLEDSAGVTLLHRHFDLHEGEVMVKRFVARKATIQPELGGVLDQMIPYMWQLQQDDSGAFRAYPLEFLHADKARAKYASGANTMVGNEGFVNEFGSYLMENRLDRVFGIGLIHNEIPVHANELLMETTNERQRVLTIRPIRSDRVGSDVSETYWAFHRQKDAVNQVCLWHCKAHGLPDAELKTVCLGHCWSCR